MRSVSVSFRVQDKVGNPVRTNFLITIFAALSLMLAMPANAVIVNVGGGIPTGMEIEDTPDGLANKTTDDADTDGTGVSYDWDDILDGTYPGPYTHTQGDFTFKSLGIVEAVFQTDNTVDGVGCVGGDEDGFGGGAKVNDNPFVTISTDPNTKADSCSGAAALEIVDQINNVTGDDQNHFILYNYWTRDAGATGDMTTYQVLRGPIEFNPDTGVGPGEYRCDDFLVKFDFDPNNNVVSVASLTWKPDNTGVPPYTNAECSGPGEWQLFDSDFDGNPGPDTGGGVGNFGFNVDPVDTGDPNANEGTFGESGVDLTSLGILSDEGPCAVFTNEGFITQTGESAQSSTIDVLSYATPLTITNCTDVEIVKTGNAASAEDFVYILDQEDQLNVHDSIGSIEANGDGVDIDGVLTSITSLINIGDTHLWQDVLAQPDYLLDETNMPADWSLDTVVCTYYDPFDQVLRVDTILPETIDGPWDQVGGVDDPDTFEIPPAQANNGIITSCVINNVTSGLIVEKVITQGDTGTATLDDFDVSVDGAEVLWTTPGSTTGGIEQVTAAAGTYTLSENDLADYTEGSWSCVDGLGAGVAISNDGAFGGADVTVAAGQVVTCSITNEKLASLTVVKNTAGDNGVFDFTSSQVGAFQLDTGIINTAQTTFANLPPAIDYDLSETIPADWNLGSASCSNGTGVLSNGSFTDISLSVGEHVTCTFNNIKQGSSSFTKITIGGDDSFDFTTDLPLGPFSLSTTDGSSAPIAGNNLIPGTPYFVTETLKPGWTLTDISCTPSGEVTTWQGDLPTRTLNLTVGAGESIDCSFTNTKDGTLIVEKQTLPDGDPSSFTFTGDLAGSITDGGQLTISGNFATAVNSEETPLAGWDLTDIACTGGTDASQIQIGATDSFVPGDTSVDVLPAPGEVITCVFTNTKRGSIRVVKEISAVGPAIQDFAFTSNLPGNAAFILSPADELTSDELLVNNLIPGTFSVSETDPAPIGWALVSSSCNDGSPPALIDVAPGEEVICTFTNAPLGSATITKTTIGGDGQFDFLWGTGNNPAVPEGVGDTFSLITPGPTATIDFSYKLLIDSPYDLTEVDVPVPVGPYSQTWNLTNTECVDATADSLVPGANGADATIVAASEETVACTFTNTLDGTLVIRKQTLPDGDVTDFPFTGSHAGLTGNLQDFENASAELSETGAPGTYGTQEIVPAGWVLTDIACTGATNSIVQIGGTDTFVDGDDAVSVDVAAGETVICTFTNTKDGSLTIIKDAVGADGSFSFNHNVPAVASPFDIDTAVNDTNVVSSALQPGSYLVTEVVPTGWDLTNIVCTGATDSTITIGGAGGFDPLDTSVTVDMLSGEDIVCTFTNTRQATIIVEKLTNPDTSTQGFSFTGDVSGGPITHGGTLTTENLSPGTYTSTETAVAGWDLTDISCDDGASSSPSGGDTGTGTATFNAEPGEIITCTFTNTIQPGQIIVDKQTAPAASPQLFDFTLTGTGVEQAFQLADETVAYNSGDLLPTSENGTYNVTETLPADWSQVSATCSDGSDPAAVDLSPGEIVTCTFVNAQAGTSTFTKVTIGGDDTFAFTTTLPGGNFTLTTSGGASPTESTDNLAAGTYTITEDELAGWELTDIVCVEDDTQDSIVDIPTRTITLNVQEGESINCTVTNALLPTLNLVKAVDGGDALPTDFVLTLTGADGVHDGGVNHVSGDSMLVNIGVAYTLSEAPDQVADYFEVGVECIDDSNQSVLPHPVTLAAGQSVTCTLTNQLNEIIYNVLAEVCIDNAPLVDYDVTTSLGVVNDVDITWIKDDGSNEVVETLLSQPAVGQLLWPGAAIVDGVAVAWPGWSCDANGLNCVQISDGLVPTMQLKFEINPTEIVVVTYPPATAGCQGNPEVPESEPAVPVPSNNPLALLLLTLMLLTTGWYFRPVVKRRF